MMNRARTAVPFPPNLIRLLATLRERLRNIAPAYFSAQEQIFFAQRLAFLIEGGVSLMDSLGLMRRQMRSRSRVRVIEAVRADIAGGQSLAHSMRKFPTAFATVAVMLVEVGETCGLLSQNLQYLADELKKRRQLQRKVIGALTYPAIVMLATISITVFLIGYLLPKLMPVFLSLHVALPASTRAVMSASAFLRKRGLLVLAVLLACAAAFGIALRRSVRIRTASELTLLSIPALGTLVRNANVAHFSRAVGLLLGSGLTLRETLVTCAAMSGNTLYKSHFLAMHEAVNRGEQVSDYLQKHPRIFPDLFAQMIAAGEQSGKLPETFLYLSDHYEREIDDAASTLSTLLEPALMLGTGALVGFIALSIISPMYAITQNLHA